MRLTTILSLIGMAASNASFAEKNYSFKYTDGDVLANKKEGKKELSYSYKPKLEDFLDEEQTDYSYSYNPGYKFEDEEEQTEYSYSYNPGYKFEDDEQTEYSYSYNPGYKFEDEEQTEYSYSYNPGYKFEDEEQTEYSYSYNPGYKFEDEEQTEYSYSYNPGYNFEQEEQTEYSYSYNPGYNFDQEEQTEYSYSYNPGYNFEADEQTEYSYSYNPGYNFEQEEDSISFVNDDEYLEDDGQVEEEDDGFLRDNMNFGDIDIGPNSVVMENYHMNNYYGMSRHQTQQLKHRILMKNRVNDLHDQQTLNQVHLRKQTICYIGIILAILVLTAGYIGYKCAQRKEMTSQQPQGV